jgi:iron complex transport system substrate-binding protein
MHRTLTLAVVTFLLVGAALTAVLLLSTHPQAPIFIATGTSAASVLVGPSATAANLDSSRSSSTAGAIAAPLTNLGGAVFDAGDHAADGSYTVSMSPMGDVRFVKIPRRIVTQDANYNDMLVAVGMATGLVATGYKGNFYDGFYRQLPGAQIHLDPSTLSFLAKAGGGMFDKEALYALHPDVFHIDPIQLASAKGWSPADVAEVARNVAPFFANRYSREDNYRGKLPYTYYSLWELSEKVAEVYHRQDRMIALKAIYDGMLTTIRAKLPALEQRPRIGLVFYNKKGVFTPFTILNGGFGQAQYRDVGARDAFAGIKASTNGNGDGGVALDLEGLVAIAPDVIIMPFAIYPASNGSATSRASFDLLLKLKDDPLAQHLEAFRQGRVYPGGTPLQGPVFYLFQVEMAAKQIYPQLFGAYRDDQQYSRSEQLFDRGRVAAILDGKPGGP